MTRQLYRLGSQIALVLVLASFAHAQLTPADATFAGLSARTRLAAYQTQADADVATVAPLVAGGTNQDRVAAYRSLTHAIVLMSGQPWTPDTELTTGLDFKLDAKLVGVGEDVHARVVFLFDAPKSATGPYKPTCAVDEKNSMFFTFEVAERKTGESVPFKLPGSNFSTPGTKLIHCTLYDAKNTKLFDYYRSVVVVQNLAARVDALQKSVDSLKDKDSAAALTARQALETIDLARKSYFAPGFQSLSGYLHTGYRARGYALNEVVDLAASLESADSVVATAKTGKDPYATATGDLRRAYKSSFDNKLVPYRVYVPSNYDKSKKYPLMVMLHGAGGTEADFHTAYKGQFPLLAEKRGYIMAAVNGRGPLSGYSKESGGEQDVLDVAELMQKSYNIDASRVYLGGHSMGGSGTWRVGLLHPEKWAGLIPMAGSSPAVWSGYEAHFKAGRKIPVMMVCGGKDALVAVVGCRTVDTKAKELGAPITYAEYPNEEHTSVVAAGASAVFDWLDAQAPAGSSRPAASDAPMPANPVFTKNVAPILNAKCVICHRTGDIAPMQFTSYEQARPWAKAISDAVTKRTMPPWFADPAHGTFKNDRRLTDREIATLVTWAKNGAPQGNPADMPAPPKLTEGWSGDRPPDMIVEMPLTYKVPKDGVLDMLNFYSPVPFKDEVWIEAVELRPQNRGVVHHSIVNVVNLPATVTKEQMLSGKKYGGTGWKLIGQAPGKGYEKHPEGVAKRIAPGQYFEFNMHYTPNGKDETDRSLLGLWFSKAPVHHEVVTRPTMEQTLIGGKPAARPLPKIPAEVSNWAIDGTMTLKDDITLYSLSPHMHYRGHDMRYTAKYPDGREEVLLDVPHFDFDWQLNYEFATPVKLPAGTVITVNAHYDNSTNNAKNPDHTKEVVWGQQSWDEMFIPWAEWTVDKHDLTKMTKEEIEKLRNAPRRRDAESNQ